MGVVLQNSVDSLSFIPEDDKSCLRLVTHFRVLRFRTGCFQVEVR